MPLGSVCTPCTHDVGLDTFVNNLLRDKMTTSAGAREVGKFAAALAGVVLIIAARSEDDPEKILTTISDLARKWVKTEPTVRAMDETSQRYKM